MHHKRHLIAFVLFLVGAFAASGGATDKARTHRKVDLHGDPLPDGALARLGTVRFQPARGSHLALFADQGKSLLFFDTATCQRVDAVTGNTKNQYQFRVSGRCSAGLSADGQILAIAGDKAFEVWDLTKNQQILRKRFSEERIRMGLKGGDFSDRQRFQDAPYVSVAVDGKGQYVLLGQPFPGPKRLGTLSLWSLNGNKLWSIDTVGVAHAAFGMDDRSMTYSDREGINLVELKSGKVRQRLVRHEAPIELPASMGTTGDCGLVIHAVGDRVTAYDAARKRQAWSKKLAGNSGDLAVSPDGTLAACFEGQDKIVVLNAKSGETDCVLKVRGSRELNRLIFRPDGKALVACGMSSLDGKRTVWYLDLQNKSLLPEDNQLVPAHVLAFSPDGKNLVSGSMAAPGSAEPGHIRFWDTATGKLQRQSDQLTRGVDFLSYSDDGKRIMTSQRYHDKSPKPCYVLDAATGTVKAQFGEGLRSAEPCFGRTGKNFYRWDGRGSKLHVFDWSGRQVREDLELPRETNQVRMSPDGTLIALLLKKPTWKPWDLIVQKVGEKKAHFELKDITHPLDLEIGPGAKTLVLRTHDKLQVYSLDSGKLVFEEPHHVLSYAFSPDGKQIALGRVTIKVRKVADGEVVQTLASSVAVRGLRYAPDGKRLASSHADRTILIWDMK